MDYTNPFKQLEPDVPCPTNLKDEIVSEIDLIRNALQVVEIYAYDLFSVFILFVSEPISKEEITPPPPVHP